MRFERYMYQIDWINGWMDVTWFKKEMNCHHMSSIFDRLAALEDGFAKKMAEKKAHYLQSLNDQVIMGIRITLYTS